MKSHFPRTSPAPAPASAPTAVAESTDPCCNLEDDTSPDAIVGPGFVAMRQPLLAEGADQLERGDSRELAVSLPQWGGGLHFEGGGEGGQAGQHAPQRLVALPDRLALRLLSDGERQMGRGRWGGAACRVRWGPRSWAACRVR